jgi:hypothetical protein
MEVANMRIGLISVFVDDQDQAGPLGARPARAIAGHRRLPAQRQAREEIGVMFAKEPVTIYAAA